MNSHHALRWLLATTCCGLPAQDVTPDRPPTAARDFAKVGTWSPLLRDTCWTYDVTSTAQDGTTKKSMQQELVWGPVPLRDGGGTCQQVLQRRPMNDRDHIRAFYRQNTDDGHYVLGNGLLGGVRGRPRQGDWDMRLLAAPIGAVNQWQWEREVPVQTSGASDRVARRPTNVIRHQARIVDPQVTVRVPLGTYECLHVRIESRMRRFGDSQQDLWFAPGIGIVRDLQSGDGRSIERVLVAFRPGRPEPADPRALIVRHIEETLNETDEYDIVRPLADDLACHLRGHFALVRVGAETDLRMLYVDDEVVPFLIDDAAFWTARLREAGGYWPEEQTGANSWPAGRTETENDREPPSLTPALHLGNLTRSMLRLESARRRTTIQKIHTTQTKQLGRVGARETRCTASCTVEDQRGEAFDLQAQVVVRYGEFVEIRLRRVE